jgi:hypothetical protein
MTLCDIKEIFDKRFKHQLGERILSYPATANSIVTAAIELLTAYENSQLYLLSLDHLKDMRILDIETIVSELWTLRRDIRDTLRR